MTSRCSASGVVLGFHTVSVVGVIGFLTLVTAEATAERRLTLRSLAHETTGTLGAAEATGALRSHAETTKTGLNAGGSRSVPGSRRRLVAELAKRGRGCVVLAQCSTMGFFMITHPAEETSGSVPARTVGRKRRESEGKQTQGIHRQTEGSHQQSRNRRRSAGGPCPTKLKISLFLVPNFR